MHVLVTASGLQDLGCVIKGIHKTLPLQHLPNLAYHFTCCGDTCRWEQWKEQQYLAVIRHFMLKGKLVMRRFGLI